MLKVNEDKMTRNDALKLLGTKMDGGRVIGVDDWPGNSYVAGRKYGRGVYLIISYRDKPSVYKKVG